MIRKHPTPVMLLCSALALPLLQPAGAFAAARSTPATTDTPTTVDTPAIAHAQQISDAFEQVASAVTPSVVTIESAKKLKVNAMRDRQLGPDAQNFLRQFFGDEFDYHALPFNQAPQSYVQEGLGSGVIVSKDGYILTNNHVVAGADEVTVKLTNDRTFTATVVGTDPKTDLAVLKVDANNLTPATLGDSDSLRVGEWVLALGNPFGLRSTMTAGIVSAKGRTHVGIADYEDFIQTDAAINPGNSGGPLVDLDGKVIGINTAIATRSGGYMGVGFAVPIGLAKTIMHTLIKEGHVVRGWLGVGIQNLNEGLAKSFNYDSKAGALVGNVLADGPAGQAGIQSGDIIVRFGNQDVADMDALREAVAETKPGTTVPTEIIRNGQHRTIDVKIGEMPDDEQAAMTEQQPDKLGLSVQDLTPEIAQQLGYENTVEGVVVTSVEPLSPADRAGLQPRDVIVSIQDTPVKDLASFKQALSKADLTAGVRMTVRTGKLQRFIFLQQEAEAPK
ncbi:MAG: DegQ family serine endoprotease [Phycisphaerales bacterium]|nr:DegQ family serine endoprotease [Phycisphaerales bacterium]